MLYSPLRSLHRRVQIIQIYRLQVIRVSTHQALSFHPFNEGYLFLIGHRLCYGLCYELSYGDCYGLCNLVMDLVDALVDCAVRL